MPKATPLRYTKRPPIRIGGRKGQFKNRAYYLRRRRVVFFLAAFFVVRLRDREEDAFFRDREDAAFLRDREDAAFFREREAAVFLRPVDFLAVDRLRDEDRFAVFLRPVDFLAVDLRLRRAVLRFREAVFLRDVERFRVAIAMVHWMRTFKKETCNG